MIIRTHSNLIVVVFGFYFCLYGLKRFKILISVHHVIASVSKLHRSELPIYLVA